MSDAASASTDAPTETSLVVADEADKAPDKPPETAPETAPAPMELEEQISLTTEAGTVVVSATWSAEWSAEQAAQIHTALFQKVVELQAMNSHLHQLSAKAEEALDASAVALRQLREKKRAGPSEESTAVVPPPASRPFTLHPNHKHAKLNSVRLVVQSWANTDQLQEDLGFGEVASCEENRFPHKVRRESDCGPLVWWCEAGRALNLNVALHMYSAEENKLIAVKDEAWILKHANQMLGDCGRRQEELTFKCDVVFADCKNGFEEDAKPKTTHSNPMFIQPGACLVNHNGSSKQSIFKCATASPPVNSYNGRFHNGMISFKNIVFADGFLSGSVKQGFGRLWKLRIRCTHPALQNMLNFTVLSDEFSTGKRIRPMKRARDSDGSEDLLLK